MQFHTSISSHVLQAWIDATTARISKMTRELETLMDDHNKRWNPSGVPFKGEKKRALNEMAEDDQSKDAVKLESGGFDNKDALKPDHTIALNRSVELCVKDKKLYLHAVEDCIVSTALPLCQLWGEFVTGSSPQEKKTIVKNKSSMMPIEVKSTSYEGHWSMVTKKGSQAFKTKPTSLLHFLEHLEDEGFASFTFECHKLVQKIVDVPLAGTRSSTFSVEPTSECYFHSFTFPDKRTSQPKQENFGSLMDFKQWDFPQGKHNAGHVKMVPAFAFNEDSNTIMPLKPHLFLVKPVKMANGQIAQIA